ncbi:hypothetical protein ACQKDZ_00035 [Alkalihalobacillus sp. NPDC078480]
MRSNVHRKMNIFHPYLTLVLGCGYFELGFALRVLDVWLDVLSIEDTLLVFQFWAWYQGSFLGGVGWGLGDLVLSLGIGFIALGNACGFLVLMLLFLVET